MSSNSSNVSIPTLRWGILGAGSISAAFATDLEIKRLEAKANHELVAVAARNLQSAQDFISEHLKSKPKAYGSYAELYADKNVDIIYIGTIHTFHKQTALDAIAAGKHVLCEKPMALNKKDTLEIIDAAKKKGVFLMEAVWTRFFPIVQTLKKLVHEDKVIGEIHRSFVDFAIKDFDDLPADHRLKDAQLGGGALLDIGIYCVTWARLVMDPNVGNKALKTTVVSSQVIDEKDKVDYTTSAILTFPETKAQSIISCSLWGNLSREIIRIEGKTGVILVYGKYASCPTKIVVSYYDPQKTEEIFEPFKDGYGYYWEADACALDIQAGKTEDDIMPLSETLNVFDIMDTIRHQNNMVYPQEK